MWTGHFEKFLEVIFGWPSLPLEVAFGSRHELLTGVADFLIVVAVAGHNRNATGLALLPLLATLSAFPSTFDGGLGGCGSTTVGDRSCITLDEGYPDHLLARSMSSFRLFATELMKQGTTGCTIPERRDDIGGGHTRKLVEVCEKRRM
jgi:hypothetical protein